MLSFQCENLFNLSIFLLKSGYTVPEVINMSTYIAPQIKEKFDTLSPGLKNIILERNVQINSIHDLINTLERIVAEAEE